MYKNGHRGAALQLMAPLTAAFGVIGIGMSVVAGAVCRFRDIDHDYSWLAHRGLTHTIWFAIVVAGVVVAGGYAALSMIPVALPVLPLALLLGTTVFLGLLSHLFADGLTIGRVLTQSDRSTRCLHTHFDSDWFERTPDSRIYDHMLKL